MSQDCVCETSSRSDKEEDSEYVQCNRIFLNFAQKFQNPVKDSFNIAKVKDLFEYLSKREDLQEIKVFGWLDEETEKEKEEEEEEELEVEESRDELECYDRSTPKGGGQRFVMSRDFWYRKLNILKAQKLDEAALEAKDMPPDEEIKEKKLMNMLKEKKEFSSELKEKKDKVYDEINLFEKSVAKPVERELKKRFVNVYDNREHFKKECK